MAMDVHRVRGAGSCAGVCAEQVLAGAEAGAGGFDGDRITSRNGVGVVEPRSVFQTAGEHADHAVPDGRVHLFELRGGGIADVDAEIVLRPVPHGTGGGGIDGDDFRATGERAGVAYGRMAGGFFTNEDASGTDFSAGDRSVVRGAVRRVVRNDAVGHVAGDRADAMGILQRHV